MTSWLSYRVFRPGVGADLQSRIQAAVTAYYERYRQLPPSIRVGACNYEAAIHACMALNLRLPIYVNGGTLRYEVELEAIPDIGRGENHGTTEQKDS